MVGPVPQRSDITHAFTIGVNDDVSNTMTVVINAQRMSNAGSTVHLRVSLLLLRATRQ